ncbi:hypothetical protein EGJ28_16210 [Stutzerimonas xanthomarina]|uniref:Uncharacterized protein n=1 Tax=Stutzerimonas xanthomarina TaxID=271420 RepID=A0A3R8U1H7_9GAMM|nr:MULTISPECIES: hypothetical protein [Stutzerimonas]MBK3919950.1 hypothetical protein [Stutzerimonas frequens]RRV08810.1 hypothetical protein EGJ28_16210 [Stutzerimonas xanthomarina]
MKLQYARLLTGSTTHAVHGSPQLPIPAEFDFDGPVACARTIFALMGHAAGGAPVQACRLRINRERRTAHLIGAGVHVLYRDVTLPMVTVSEAKDMVRRKVEEAFDLGTIAPFISPLSTTGANHEVL